MTDTELLFKAQKRIDKFDFSKYQWIKEYQKNMLGYYQTIFEMIIYGITEKIGADPSQLKKSINIKSHQWNYFFKANLNKENQTINLIKGLFDNIRKKIAFSRKLWQKFGFGKKSIFQRWKDKPMKIKGKFVYNQKGKPITGTEWNNLEDSIVDFLKPSNIEEEIVVRGAMFGKLLQQMEQQEVPKKKQQNMSWEEVMNQFGIKNIPNTIEEANKKLSKQEQNALGYAKDHAAKFLAIKDGTLKNQMISLIREQVERAIEDRISPQELAQRLFWIDPNSKFGKEWKPEHIEVINRNYKRIAITEMQFAMQEGYLAACREATDGDLFFVYSGGIKYSQVSVKSTGTKASLGQVPKGETKTRNYRKATCNSCEGWLGKIAKWVPEKPKNGSDKSDDPRAQYLIWPGKNNVGRKKWWIASPAHPFCGHDWQQIDPDTQQYDKKTGLITRKEEAA